jgi:ketoreductase RED1
VVGGSSTSPEVVQWTADFFTLAGKSVIKMEREVPGFVANRLQSALFQECVHLVAEGVVGMDDLDDVVMNSIGLRWAAGGPFLTFHLGGGAGGLPHFLAHLGPGTEWMWKQGLGHPSLDEATMQVLLAEVERAYGDRSIDELSARRDRLQVAILNALADDGTTRSPTGD